MGAVLAMRRLWITMAGLLALSGCGNAGNSPFAAIGAVVSASLDGEEEKAQDPRQVLTRESIEQIDNELMLVEVPSRGAVATLATVGENAGRVTWMSRDGISLTEAGGLLVATRGFGADLMVAETAPLRGLLSGAADQVTRRYEFLAGSDELETRIFTCRVQERAAETIEIFERRYATTRVEEYCDSAEVAFLNLYWIDSNGTIWRSRQLVSPELGFIRLERL